MTLHHWRFLLWSKGVKFAIYKSTLLHSLHNTLHARYCHLKKTAFVLKVSALAGSSVHHTLNLFEYVGPEEEGVIKSKTGMPLLQSILSFLSVPYTSPPCRWKRWAINYKSRSTTNFKVFKNLALIVNLYKSIVHLPWMCSLYEDSSRCSLGLQVNAQASASSKTSRLAHCIYLQGKVASMLHKIFMRDASQKHQWQTDLKVTSSDVNRQFSGKTRISSFDDWIADNELIKHALLVVGGVTGLHHRIVEVAAQWG